jgi:1-acyl-sn-glycerol-3-phosphate acyltransferase
MNPFSVGPRAIATYNVVRHMHLRVEGTEHLPSTGPALIAARHYHHLFDGSALVHGLARQPHIFVALDWTRSFWERLLMETVCNLAEWPIAVRSGSFADGAVQSAFSLAESDRYVRRAIARGAELLHRGEVLAIFPEGYPTIDPVRSRKSSDDEFLPFARGLCAIAAQAERRGAGRIPIVPAGLRYVPRGAGNYDVTLRLGPAWFIGPPASRAGFLEELRTCVRELSA